jgi:hypothetical protein
MATTRDAQAGKQAEALAMYAGGATSRAVAAFLGVSKPTALGVLRRGGAVIRAASRPALPVREDAFDNAETDEAAAYWAGFLMADGCISHQGGTRRVILELQAGDRAHVEAFAAFLGAGRKLIEVPAKSRIAYGRTIHIRASVRFHATSRRLADALARYGVVPRKSKTAEARLLEGNAHFWRGVVDGDGYLGFQDGVRGRTPVLSLCGSEPLVRQFQAFVRMVTRSRTSVYFGRGAWNLTHSRCLAVRLAETLYGDATVALPRKLAIAQEMIAAGHKDRRTRDSRNS